MCQQLGIVLWSHLLACLQAVCMRQPVSCASLYVQPRQPWLKTVD
jgi:hypothetical protein